MLDYEHWNSFLLGQGVSKEQSGLLAEYANSLIKNQLPVIFEIEHFCQLLGVEKAYIYRATSKSRLFYRSFNIKGKTKVRRINSPYPKLNYIQTWIKENILEKIDVSQSAYAYVKSRSILDNANLHLGCAELLKLDIKDYFSSIDRFMVADIFKLLGYTSKLSNQLARLCCVDGVLPQGAPTSPIISNLIMRGLDRQLEFISERYDLKYSRYADDMAFSGRTISSEFIIAVVHLIKSYGFELNQKKFAHKKINQRKMVTGLCISGSHVRVLKKARRKFRQNHYCLMRYKENSFNGTFGDLDLLHLDRVLGHGRFIQYIEPDNLYVNKAVDELVVLKKELLCP